MMIEHHLTTVNYSDPGERELSTSPSNTVSGPQPEGSVGPTVIELQEENPPPAGFELRTDGIYIVGGSERRHLPVLSIARFGAV